MAGAQTGTNQLYYGDNLDVLREHIAAESVDLVYLDPPFNSNRSYNVLFKDKSGAESRAQIEAFDDTWTWSQETEQLYYEIVNGGAAVAVQDALEAMRKLLGDNDVLAYLVMMTARLVELHRVLKDTGSLYLHCDPTGSHYLKVLLDAIFGPRRFGGEIVWKRTTAHSDSKQGRKLPGRVHDIILLYTKSDDYLWNTTYTEYSDEYQKSHYRWVEEGTGRRYRKADLTAAKPGGDTSYEWRGVYPYSGRYWAYSREKMEQFHADGRLIYTRSGMPELKRYMDETPGVPLQDVWTDISPINPRAAERLGYPTQKPLSLLERIIEASSNPGDVVLDSFAGCGTSIDAAQKLDRRWIGIDITTIAVDLIDARLRHTYGESIRQTYRIEGIPQDLAGAEALFKHSPFEFERWCVMLLDGTPNEKQVGDKGIDGVIKFLIDAKGKSDRALISVKGGNTNPGHVRDLGGTVSTQKAAMGVFVCLKTPTKGMIDEANHSGVYKHPGDGKSYPRVQIITVEQLLNDERPKLPVTLLPYLQAQKRSSKGVGQVTMDFAELQGTAEIEP